MMLRFSPLLSLSLSSHDSSVFPVVLSHHFICDPSHGFLSLPVSIPPYTMTPSSLSLSPPTLILFTPAANTNLTIYLPLSSPLPCLYPVQNHGSELPEYRPLDDAHLQRWWDRKKVHEVKTMPGSRTFASTGPLLPVGRVTPDSVRQKQQR